MGTKGYRNIAKSGVKAVSARQRQAVEKARTRKKPKPMRPPRKPRDEVASEDNPEEAQNRNGQGENQ